MVISELKKQDYKKAIDFAIKGMHFDRYIDSSMALKLYGKCFLYMELCRATEVLAAYEGDKLLGVLLAEMYGDSPKFRTLGKLLYVWAFKKIQSLYASDSDFYDIANQAMLTQYQKKYTPEGEILLLAADPNGSRKGVGTALLAELEKRKPDCEIYLYTDNNCTYQFYEARGFERAAEQNVFMSLPDAEVTLTCFLYHKRSASRST